MSGSQDGKEPPWHNGNGYETFTKLMAMQRLGPNEFQSAFPAYSPGGGTRAYGGHVYSQAALAAARTVEGEFVIHSITGHFTLEGLSSTPFTYKVRTIRNGYNYCQRQVDVYQDNPRLQRRRATLESEHTRRRDGSGTGRSDDTTIACFTAVVSFKRAEPSVLEVQRPADLLGRFPMLATREPGEWDECPGVDSPWYWEVEREYGKCRFPGLKSTKVDMGEYNASRSTLDRRQLQWYRVIGGMPKVADDPNMHAAAHLYASDRNGLFIVPNFLDLGNNFSAMASLSHTVIFHVSPTDLNMIDSSSSSSFLSPPSSSSSAAASTDDEPPPPTSTTHQGNPTGHWFCQELQVDRIGSGRATVTGRIWRRDGLHVASHYQDGLVKMRVDDDEGEGVGLEKKKGVDAAEQSRAVFSKGKL